MSAKVNVVVASRAFSAMTLHVTDSHYASQYGGPETALVELRDGSANLGVIEVSINDLMQALKSVQEARR